MTSAEFSLWLQYHAESPIDDSRGDLHAGIIAAEIANYAGCTRREDAPPARPMDYMPFIEHPEIESTVDDDDPLAFFRKLR